MAKWCKIFIVLFFLPPVLHSQNQNIKFDHLTMRDGISSNTVYSILQDRQGFMWFGTREGLNRYDGHSFKTYRYDPVDSSSISDNFIWFESLCEDQDGMIWIGTKTGGLNRFDPVTETFKRFQHHTNDSLSLSSNNNLSLFLDQSGTLWVGTDAGLNRFNHATEKFERFQHNPNDTTSLSHNRIWEICETGLGDKAELWIATHNGLDKFDRTTGGFEHIKLNGLNPKSRDKGPITDIYSDQRGTLWLGSFHGLVKLNLRTMVIKFYRHDPENSNSLSFNVITDIWQDPGTQGQVLWLTTEPPSNLIFTVATQHGLNRFDTKTETFDHYSYSSTELDRFNISSVVALYEDKKQSLWIGSHADGIFKLNQPSGNFNLIKNVPGNPNSLSGWQVQAIHEDQTGVSWIGTEKGLNKLDRETGIFTKYTFDPDTGSVISPQSITGIAQERNGMLWLGTWEGGLLRFDPKTGQFRQYRHGPMDTNSLPSNEVGRVFFDSFGTLWLGTGNQMLSRLLPEDQRSGWFTNFKLEPEVETGFENWMDFAFLENSHGEFWIGSHLKGLFRFDRETGKFTSFKYDQNDPRSLSSNIVNGLVETYSEHDTVMWVATGNGLNRFDRSSQTFKRIYNNQPGGSDYIFSVTSDVHGNIWIQNQKGLSKFDPVRETFVNYAGSRGLHADMTNGYGYLRNHRGEIFFAGNGGIIYFHPDSILSNEDVPPVVLTDFKIFNEPADLDSSITLKKRVDLTYDQNFFSFEFAALDYTDPGKNQYAYMLEGLDKDWIRIGNHHSANYTAVRPGQYIFRVRGSNNDGIWNEEGVSLAINIHPPWWQTNWAYSLYVLFVLSMVYGFWRFQTGRLKMKQQMEMEHFEAEKLREVDHLKSRFFANISHEFRTPLTLILGPLQKFLSAAKEKETYEDFLAMQRNARRLQELIDQLLDLSKLDAQRMPLRTKPDNIVRKIRELTSAFSSLAETRNIELRFSADEESIIVYFDTDKLQKIIYNLLGNAFKFTPDGGTVIVDCGLWIGDLKDRNHSQILDFVKITITDTGAGIPPDQLEHIFDRFYQVDEGSTRTHAGTGIGLALTQELVHLHHGEIGAESEVGKGSTFTILLPLGRDHLSDDEVIDELSEEKIQALSQQPTPELVHKGISTPVADTQTAANTNGNPLILIVEDNQDMRRFLRNCLTECYDIIEAENGESGVGTAFEKIPDLIVSDVMMPDMDGLELCRKLKSDERTCHIPIILLTARASRESKVEGLETGADDYIVKPFDAEELRVRIKNLIDQRQKLRERFQREILLPPGQVVASSCEEKFLQRAMDIVQAQMTDADFGVPGLALALGMSRVQLHRKLNALTGLSASRFIRSLRLRRATELLKQRSGNVAEIAYEVGFNNVPYFHKCFLEQFGKTPAQYISPLRNAPDKLI